MTHPYDESLPARALRQSLACMPALGLHASTEEQEVRRRIQGQMAQVAAMWAFNHAFASAIIAADEAKKAIKEARK